MRGSRGGGVGWKITKKYRVSLQYWSGSSGKSQSYKASIHCWAIICTPAKRHFIEMAFRWRADGDPLIVVFWSFLPSSTKQTVRVGPPLKTNLDPRMPVDLPPRLDLLSFFFLPYTGWYRRPDWPLGLPAAWHPWRHTFGSSRSSQAGESYQSPRSPSWGCWFQL